MQGRRRVVEVKGSNVAALVEDCALAARRRIRRLRLVHAVRERPVRVCGTGRSGEAAIELPAIGLSGNGVLGRDKLVGDKDLVQLVRVKLKR